MPHNSWTKFQRRHKLRQNHNPKIIKEEKNWHFHTLMAFINLAKAPSHINLVNRSSWYCIVNTFAEIKKCIYVHKQMHMFWRIVQTQQDYRPSIIAFINYSEGVFSFTLFALFSNNAHYSRPNISKLFQISHWKANGPWPGPNSELSSPGHVLCNPLLWRG